MAGVPEVGADVAFWTDVRNDTNRKAVDFSDGRGVKAGINGICFTIVRGREIVFFFYVRI